MCDCPENNSRALISRRLNNHQRNFCMERTDNMPLWVFLAFMSIETRKGALILTWCSFAFTVFCIPLSYYLNDWWWLGMMIPITAWYWLSLRWCDKHSAWS
jgi:hypothetical protein